MEVTLVTGTGYCQYTEKFEINGVDASIDDFGDTWDHDKDHAPEHGCGNMKFEPKRASSELLAKYKITIEEFYEICDLIDSKVSWGRCAMCS